MKPDFEGQVDNKRRCKNCEETFFLENIIM